MLLKQPFDQCVVQAAPMAAAFVLRVNEQCPDVAGNCVANGETDNRTLILRDPSAASDFNG